ncbi:MAG: hypothetical protein R3C58_03595 [Parvularculaceae bacterium]
MMTGLPSVPNTGTTSVEWRSKLCGGFDRLRRFRWDFTSRRGGRWKPRPAAARRSNYFREKAPLKKERITEEIAKLRNHTYQVS